MTTPTIEEIRVSLNTAGSESETLAASLALATQLVRIEHRESLELAEASRQMAENLSDRHAAARASAVIGKAHILMGNYHRALEAYTAALALYLELDDPAGVAEVKGNMGIIYVYLSECAQALDQFRSAREFYESVEDRQQIARAALNMGIVYTQLGEYATALDHFQVAHALDEEIGNQDGVAHAIASIGNIYKQIGEYSRALDEYSAALRLHEELGHISSAAATMMNMGHVYCDSDALAEALACYHSALEIYEKVGNRVRYAHVQHAVGRVHLRRGEYAEALEQFHAALSLLHEQGVPVDTAHVLGDIAGVYMADGFDGYDAASAERYLLQAIEVASAGGIKDLLCQLLDSMSKLYERESNWESAYRYAREFFQVSRELQNLEAHKKAQQFEHRRQIGELEKQHAIEQAEAEMQRMKNEQLERDLSNSTLHLLAQTELLASLRSDLLKIARKIPPTEPVARELRDRIKRLPCESVDWEKFDRQFRAVHPEFVRHLIDRAPDLTTTEVRICAMLRMSMKSHEIAGLFCITEAGIEFHRKNIRRKLKLQRDEKLPVVLGAM